MNSICRRSTCYPLRRFIVPDDKVSWDIYWPEYRPPNYSAPHLSSASWADPAVGSVNFKPKWNEVDEGIDRRSYDHNKRIRYDVLDDLPLNPRGRTGMSGRGRLGRWGPNQAADAVITRWKRIANGSCLINLQTGRPILEFIAILRKDCGQWAFPGGFIDPGEEPFAAVVRELHEEAIDSEQCSNETNKSLHDFFTKGKEIYKGYVDDPRNTDNAWIETMAVNFHDENEAYTENIILQARDDAADVKWMDTRDTMSIYPTHLSILEIVNQLYLKSV